MRYKRLIPNLQLPQTPLSSSSREAFSKAIAARREMQIWIRQFESAILLIEHSTELIGQIIRQAIHEAALGGAERSAQVLEEFDLDLESKILWRKSAANGSDTAIQGFCTALRQFCLAVERICQLSPRAIEAGDLAILQRIKELPLMHAKQPHPLPADRDHFNLLEQVERLKETLECMVEMDSQLNAILVNARLVE